MGKSLRIFKVDAIWSVSMDIEQVRKEVETMLPDPVVRKACLELLKEYIQFVKSPSSN